MGAKPKKTAAAKSAKKAPAKRTPAKRTPARKAAAKSVRTPSGARAGATVDAYVASLTGWQKDAAGRLRDIIHAAAPDAAESIKWGQPVYEDNGPVCYFKAHTEHITFGFWRGTELDDLEWRLEGEGEHMKHLVLRSADEVTESSLGGFVRQAVDLNRRLGSPTARGETPPEREAAPAPQVAPDVEPQLEADAEQDLAAMVVPVEPAEDTTWRDESSY